MFILEVSAVPNYPGIQAGNVSEGRHEARMSFVIQGKKEILSSCVNRVVLFPEFPSHPCHYLYEIHLLLCET